MNYEQVIQTRKYEFGENKEIKTREEAVETIRKVKQNLITKISLEGIFKISEVKIEEKSNEFEITVITNVPKFFD